MQSAGTTYYPKATAQSITFAIGKICSIILFKREIENHRQFQLFLTCWRARSLNVPGILLCPKFNPVAQKVPK